MSSSSFWSSNKAIPALVLIGAASYFLLVEHREHLYQWLPFLIIALCPLMHIFMHSGHGSHNHSHQNDQDQTQQNKLEEAAYLRGLEEGKRQHDKDEFQ